MIAIYINDHYALNITQELLEKIAMMSGTKLKTGFKEDIYTFLKENATLCTALLSTNGDIIFIENLKNLVRIKSINAWNFLK